MSELSTLTVLLGVIQFLTMIVLTLVGVIMRGIMRDHKELAGTFESFRLEMTKYSMEWKDFEPYHRRLHHVEDEALRIATLLRANGIDKN